MKKLAIGIGIVLALVCLATAQAASDIPSIQVANPTYTEAADKAQQAFFIQTGLNNQYHLIQDYGTNQGRTTLATLGIDKEIGALLYGMRAYRARSIDVPVSHTTRLTLQPSQLSIRINF